MSHDQETILRQELARLEAEIKSLKTQIAWRDDLLDAWAGKYKPPGRLAKLEVGGDPE